MRLLITGATGFFGSHIARACIARGDTVRATKRAHSSLDRVADIRNSVEWHDAADPAPKLATDMDVVLHCATHYGRGHAADAEVERVNLNWPILLLAATRAPARFVNVDTSLPPALSAYARTKRRFAEHARDSADRGAARVLNVNLESVYGPGDDGAKFQMTLIHALLRNDPTFALSPGEQTRDYIFISDAVDAMLRLMDHAVASDQPLIAAGVGRGEGISIRRFSEVARDIAKSSTRLQFGAMPYRDGELMRAAADISLLGTLGWRAGHSLEAGLRETIAAERSRR